jgi:phosphonoacetaldehyde hydrolase
MTPVAVVFDWAGTMIDFGCQAPVEALRRAFAGQGVTLDDDQIRRDMGRAKRDHVHALLADPKVRHAWIAAWGREPDDVDDDTLMSALEPLMAATAEDHATLVPGAAGMLAALRARGVRIGSCTGYTRAMMAGVLPRAAQQGYAPEATVCAGETPLGRPSPLMLWRVLAELRAWPVFACVKVDDAPVGVAEGVAAGTWSVGVTASGNGVGLDLPAWRALGEGDRRDRMGAAAAPLRAAGADFVIETVADLPGVLDEIAARLAAGERPGVARMTARRQASR